MADRSGQRALTTSARVYEKLGSAIGFDTEVQEVTDRWVGIGLAILGIGSLLSLALLQRVP